MDDATYKDAAKSALILVGFLMLAVVWEKLYLAFIRNRYLRIQRWKVYSKIRYRVELLHCFKKRRTLNYPREDGADASARAPFSEGIDLTHYEQPRGAVRTQAVSMTRMVIKTREEKEKAKVGKLWSGEGKRKRKGPFRRWYEDCCRGKKRKSWRNSHSEDLIAEKGAFSFCRHNWVPKEREGRSFSKYLRGNFLNLFGSLVSVGLIVVGAVAALLQSGVTFGSTLTGTSLLAVAAFLKFPDFLTSAIAYFGIVCSDILERGDIVEISTPVLATGGGKGEGLIGGVLLVTWTHVHFLYIDVEGSSSSNGYGSFEKNVYLSKQGLKPVASLFSPGQAEKTVQGSKKRDDARGTPGPALDSPPTLTSLAVPSASSQRQYVEQDEVHFVSTKAVPIAHVAACVVDRKVSWVPVVVLSRVATGDFNLV